MRRTLILAAFAVAIAPAAWAADGCDKNPKGALKQVESTLKKQKASITKDNLKTATAAINRAKMANKFGNDADACKSIDEARAALGIKS